MPSRAKLHISWLWLPYLFVAFQLELCKVTFYIFFMLSLHEMAHVACAIWFHYPLERITVYPFGLAATITYIGYGSLFQETVMLAAGPLMHVLFPSFFHILMNCDVISPSFYAYVCMLNASILLFNLLPIYPLDGGRLLQTFFHTFLRFKTANRMTFLTSFLVILFLLYFHVLKGLSSMAVLLFLALQLFSSWHQLPYDQLRFFRYRLYHPCREQPLCNEREDLYRGRYNLMKGRRGWQKEENWLRQRFGNHKNSVR